MIIGTHICGFIHEEKDIRTLPKAFKKIVIHVHTNILYLYDH